MEIRNNRRGRRAPSTTPAISAVAALVKFRQPSGRGRLADLLQMPATLKRVRARCWPALARRGRMPGEQNRGKRDERFVPRGAAAAGDRNADHPSQIRAFRAAHRADRPHGRVVPDRARRAARVPRRASVLLELRRRASPARADPDPRPRAARPRSGRDRPCRLFATAISASCWRPIAGSRGTASCRTGRSITA